MAFDAKPSTWLGAGYTLASSQIKLNTATHAAPICVPELTDAEADPTTGDVRKLFFALSEAMFQSYNGTAVDSRPTKMTLSRISSQANDGTVTRSYSFQFTCSVGAAEVAAE